jgi:hypothetical protein
MSSLTIYASGKRVVVWDGTSAWQPDSGQFLLNFETKQNTEAHSAHGATAKRPVKAEAALTWFERTIGTIGTPGRLSRRSASGLSGDRPRTAGFVEAHANLGLPIITPVISTKPRRATAVPCRMGRTPHSRISTSQWSSRIKRIHADPSRHIKRH